MTTKVPKKKLLKRLQVSQVVDIGLLRPATIPQVIMEFNKVMDICRLKPDSLN